MQVYIPSAKEQEQLIKNTIIDTLNELLPKHLNGSKTEEWLSVSQVAERLGYCEATIYRLKDRGELPFTQHGRKILFPWSRIEREFLEANLVSKETG